MKNLNLSKVFSLFAVIALVSFVGSKAQASGEGEKDRKIQVTAQAVEHLIKAKGNLYSLDYASLDLSASFGATDAVFQTYAWFKDMWDISTKDVNTGFQHAKFTVTRNSDQAKFSGSIRLTNNSQTAIIWT